MSETRSNRTGKLDRSGRARIVTVSMNELNYRESKIGLTMRQVGLGTVEWLEEDRKLKEQQAAEGGAPRREPKRQPNPTRAAAATPPTATCGCRAIASGGRFPASTSGSAAT